MPCTYEMNFVFILKDMGAFRRIRNTGLSTEGKTMVQDLNEHCIVFPYGETPVGRSSPVDRVDTTEYLTKGPSEFDTNQCVTIRDLIEEATTDPDGSLHSLSQRKELELQAFEGYLYRNVDGSTVEPISQAKVWSQALIGYDPGEVSALFILDYVRVGGGLMQTRSDKRNGGHYMRIKDGVSAFSERLLQRLIPVTLRLKSPVTSRYEIE